MFDTPGRWAAHRVQLELSRAAVVNSVCDRARCCDSAAAAANLEADPNPTPTPEPEPSTLNPNP